MPAVGRPESEENWGMAGIRMQEMEIREKRWYWAEMGAYNQALSQPSPSTGPEMWIPTPPCDSEQVGLPACAPGEMSGQVIQTR